MPKHPFTQINEIMENHITSCLQVGMSQEARAWSRAKRFFSATLAGKLGQAYVDRLLEQSLIHPLDPYGDTDAPTT